ncbi:MAG: UDP-N-acetylglucosamine 2-epimerase [Alphaproteobacteria bacterium]
MMKKICIVTGSRAEYGLLYWTIKKLENAPEVDLHLVVTGSHLSDKFGNTINEINPIKIKNLHKINILSSNDNITGISKTIQNAIQKFSIFFIKNKFDSLIVLGDRYEIFGVVQAAMINKLPISHLHGGESTYSLMDDAIRHSITKMSHLHFTTSEVYKKRVIKMGESPKNVFNFGPPCIDNIKRSMLLNKKTLQLKLNINLESKVFLITFHPETLLENDERNLLNFLSVLKEFKCSKIFTGVNADINRSIIHRIIKDFVKLNDSCFHFDSLGRINYLSLMKISNLVLGNSSSGVIEAPLIGVPSINLGERQKGRERKKSVINCDFKIDNIYKSIEIASNKKFKVKVKAESNKLLKKYTDVSDKISDVILNTDMKKLLLKKFYEKN